MMVAVIVNVKPWDAVNASTEVRLSSTVMNEAFQDQTAGEDHN